MALNATFNNISVISWRSALLMEEAGVPEENHRPALHKVISSTCHHERESNAQLLVMIGPDCTGSCKSNYRTITTTTIRYMVRLCYYLHIAGQ